MNKRYLHHLWTLIRPVKTWHLLVAFVVCASVCTIALRSNYQHMIRLRDAVYAADMQADPGNGNIEQALQQLRAYVGQHMNTSLATPEGVYPPIQLVHTYERLKQTEQARVNAVNAQVYTQAQTSCEARFPASRSGGPRVPCIEQYVKEHGVAVKQVPAAMYMFDFVSPRWSPDLAGWSLVAAIFFLLLALLRFIAGWWLHRATR